MDFKGLSDPVVLFKQPDKKSGVFQKLRPPVTNFLNKAGVPFRNKNLLVGGLTVFMLFAVGLGVYLSQKPTQLKPQASETATLFPVPTQPPPTVARAAVNHFYLELPGGGIHYYATNDTPSGWTALGPSFFAYSTQQPGTVPIRHFYFEAPGGGRHYYSVSDVPPGWTEQPVAFYAYSTQQPGTVPIRHFYFEAPGGGIHYYSINDIPPGWTEYPPAFYAFSDAGIVNGDYADWSGCSAACGGGNQIRTCSDPAPANGGTDCSGIGPTSESCNTQACPLPPVNAVWSPWSACSVTCGTGVEARTCTEQQNGGIPCSQTDGGNASRTCNTQACPTLTPTPTPSPSPSSSPSPSPSPSPQTKGDGNNDGKVDLQDLSLMFTRWSPAVNIISHFQLDFNDDLKINSFDHSKMNDLLYSLGILKK